MNIDMTGMGKMKLPFRSEFGDLNVMKTFTGKWIVGDEKEGLRADDDTCHWDAGAEWSVALTAKGNLVVYLTHCNEGFEPEMDTYSNFEEMKAERLPANVLAATAAALGEDYEIELDI